MNDIIPSGGVPTVVGFGTLLNAIETAIETPGFNIETVERMFGLVMQMQVQQAKAEFTDARAMIDVETQPIVKNATNTHLHNRYADIDAILTALKPVCAKYGVVISFSEGEAASPENFRLNMTLSRGHYSETIHIEIPRRIAGSAGNRIGANDQQGVGILVTYARRYLLRMAFNLSDEDTDGEVPGTRQPPPQQNHGVAQSAPQAPSDAEALAAAAAFFDALKRHLAKAATGEHIDKVAAWAQSKLSAGTPAIVLNEVADIIAEARAELDLGGADGPDLGNGDDAPPVSDKAQELLQRITVQADQAGLTALIEHPEFGRSLLPLPDRERNLIDMAVKAKNVELGGL